MLFSDEEIEAFRLEEIALIEADEKDDGFGGPRWEDFQPGSYGAHEVLHLASVFRTMVEEHLLNHKTIISDPDFYRFAHRAMDSLFDLYQAIGAKHLGDDEIDPEEQAQPE
ncbi:MAG: hypothetical protein C0606_16325 [Hyphomicrobiales bacterium]|nr:MAG: hypothetical protein C0606_16325 [Hyphomicrobiales bacterium]